jgi:DnaJ-class molecular chaperone
MCCSNNVRDAIKCPVCDGKGVRVFRDHPDEERYTQEVCMACKGKRFLTNDDIMDIWCSLMRLQWLEKGNLVK